MDHVALCQLNETLSVAASDPYARYRSEGDICTLKSSQLPSLCDSKGDIKFMERKLKVICCPKLLTVYNLCGFQLSENPDVCHLHPARGFIVTHCACPQNVRSCLFVNHMVVTHQNVSDLSESPSIASNHFGSLQLACLQFAW